MKKIKKLLMGFLLFFGGGTGVLAGVPPILGHDILPGQAGGGTTYVANNLFPGVSSGILVFILGSSVIMLMIAGILYLISSGGDQAKTAKNIMIWTIAGSGIAILSYAAVKFVLGISFFG